MFHHNYEQLFRCTSEHINLGGLIRVGHISQDAVDSRSFGDFFFDTNVDQSCSLHLQRSFLQTLSTRVAYNYSRASCAECIRWLLSTKHRRNARFSMFMVITSASSRLSTVLFLIYSMHENMKQLRRNPIMR